MPVVDLILLLIAVAVVGVVAAVAVGRVQGGLEEPVLSRRDHALPERRLDHTDLARVRFSVGLRGYRMDEVDAALDRVQAELCERDAELERLREALRDRQPAREVDDATPEESSSDAGSGSGG